MLQVIDGKTGIPGKTYPLTDGRLVVIFDGPDACPCAWLWATIQATGGERTNVTQLGPDRWQATVWIKGDADANTSGKHD